VRVHRQVERGRCTGGVGTQPSNQPGKNDDEDSDENSDDYTNADGNFTAAAGAQTQPKLTGTGRLVHPCGVCVCAIAFDHVWIAFLPFGAIACGFVLIPPHFCLRVLHGMQWQLRNRQQRRRNGYRARWMRLLETSPRIRV